MSTSTSHKRLSLQPAYGLPSPISSPKISSFRQADTASSVAPKGGQTSTGERQSVATAPATSSAGPTTTSGTSSDSDNDELGHTAQTGNDNVEYSAYPCETLISCLTNLSLASLPPCSVDVDGSGPIVARFPAPPPPRESSALGSREEQRRIYLGPKLSDRATGGPDAGPLIERFSCLFKNRE